MTKYAESQADWYSRSNWEIQWGQFFEALEAGRIVEEG